MIVWEFCLILWLGALAAGFLGSLTGLGGGVVLAALAFALQRDRLYVAITLFVLAILLSGLAGLQI